MEGRRIAVVGVGAIGGAVAADLADLGRHEMLLCTRSPFERLTVKHPDGVSRPVATVALDPRDVSPVDTVLLATKAHQSAGARPWLDALCSRGTCVAVLQNGVDHIERVGPLLRDDAAVLPVVVRLPGEKLSPGEIEQSRHGTLIVPDDEPGRSFAALFEGARTTVHPRADFATQMWWKLMTNAALGGVCALVLRENGVVKDPELHRLVLEMMHEVARVGRAEGAELADDAPEKALDVMLKAAGTHWSSITVDRREGRALEWEARNAVVGRRGRKHGIPTPLNDTITTLLRTTSPANT